MQRNVSLLVVAVLAVWSMALPANARSRKVVPGKPKAMAQADHLSREDRLRYNYFFFEAVRQQNAGHYAEAHDLLAHCLEIDTLAAQAYYMQAFFLSELGRDKEAMAYMEKAARLRPDNDTYQEKVAHFYINTGDYAKATETYERLYAARRDRSDVLNILARLYQQQKDYDKMLSAIDRLEQVEGENEQFALARMSVYEMMGDSKKAHATLKKLAESHPNDLTYSIMLGNWLMQNSRQKEAYKLFAQALKSEPDNTYALSSMYDYYRAAGQEAEAGTMMERILLGKNTPAESRTQFLRRAIQEYEQQGLDSTKTLALFERIRQVVPRDVAVAELQVAYYTLKAMPEAEVNRVLTELLTLAPDNGGARFQLIQNKWKHEDWAEVARLSEPGMLYNPDEMAFYYFTGLARYYQKDDLGALDAFQRGTAEINSKSDPEIVSDFYAIMGDIYHSRGAHDKAYAAFDSCLQWRPNHVMTLNNYAYFLAIDGGNLKKAEEMSARTVKEDPKNPTYLDTYAWILYCQGRYEEARIYIDQALQNSADSTLSADVLEHAGDIYVKAGDTPAALKMWQRAIEGGGDAAALGRKINLYTKQK